jgi:hypothetical protein
VKGGNISMIVRVNEKGKVRVRMKLTVKRGTLCNLLHDRDGVIIVV